jgi:hypothetical protein
MISTLNQIISTLQQQQEGESEKFKKALQGLIPELNTSIDKMVAESIEPKYFDAKNMEPEKMVEIIKALEDKVIEYK